MRFFINILISCVMVQVIGSCTNSGATHVDIEWRTSVLPEDKEGQPHEGLAGPLVGMIDNYVLIGGGANFPDKLPWEGGTKTYHKAVFIYQWINNNLEYKKSIVLPTTIAYSGNCSFGDKWFVAGGENENGLLRAVYKIGLSADLELELDTLPPLPYGLTATSMTCINGVLYVIGGDREQKSSDEIWRLDSQNDKAWKEVANLPEPLSNMVVATVEDKVYIAGGRRKQEGQVSPFSNRLYVYDPSQGTVVRLQDMPRTIAAAVGIAQGGRLYVLGGDKGETFHQVERLLLDAANEPNEQRKKEIIEEKNKLQIGHPGFSKEQLLYVVEENRWEVLLSDFPFEMPVTTTAIAVGKEHIVVPSGEIRAGVRTDNIFIGSIKEK